MIARFFITLLLIVAPSNLGAQDDYLNDQAQFSIVKVSGEGVDAIFAFRLKNTSKRPMLTFDPACLFRYVFPEVRDSDGNPLRANRIDSGICPHRIVCIGPGRTYKGEFTSSIGEMFSLTPDETYSVEFKFSNEPSGAELQVLRRIVKENNLTKNGRFLVGTYESNEMEVTVPF